MKKTLFICHASEDKEDFVRPLVEQLRVHYEVWYDEYKLVMGASLLEEISKGLKTCDYGVVVLSKHFFGKKWPQRELDGLFALEEKDKKVILPVWKDVNEEDVRSYSPILAGLVAARAKDGLKAVVDMINHATSWFDHGKSVQRSSTGLSRLQNVLEKKEEVRRSDSIIESEDGVKIALEAAKRAAMLLEEKVASLTKQGTMSFRLTRSRPERVDISVDDRQSRIWMVMEYQPRFANSASEAKLNIRIIKAELGSWGGDIRPGRDIENARYSPFVDLKNQALWKSGKGNLLASEDLVDLWLEKLSAVIEKE